MTAAPSTASDLRRADIGRPAHRARRFAELTPKGAAIVVAVCAANALRRTTTLSELFDDPLQWTVRVIVTFFSSLLVAIPIVAAVLVTYNRLPLHGWRLYAALGVSVALASAFGTLLLVAMDTGGAFGYLDDPMSMMREWRSLFVQWPRYLVYGLLFAGLYVYVRQRQESDAAMRQVVADRSGLERRLTEARLQMLQAQIEPHFLFNTLANVRRLYQLDRVSGSDMLGNLMRYLAVALPKMREAGSTLGREAELTEAFLSIHRIRMGRRLDFTIDVPESLHDAPVPPMLIVPLAENAIKHGLNPLPQGGAVRIRAADENGRLVVSVADTGQGFVSTSGGGTGLANLRARLTALYGDEGTLSMTDNTPHGVVARIVLPRVAAVNAVT